jgi:serine/threonine-protein phosphatase 2A activator
VEQITRETPPVNNAASRFGNPAFRTFYDQVTEVSAFHMTPPKFSYKYLEESQYTHFIAIS